MADPATDTFGGLDLDTVVRGALPQSNVDAPKIQSDLIAIGKQEAAQKGALADRMVSGIERDKAEMHKAREGIEPVPDMKWDANKEREKYTADPMQQFGSLGFIAVTLASAFTRQPMINALTAAGSFMDAANKKNDKDYDRAYEAFKENASLAMKRHEMQREAFDDAMKMMNSDVSAGKAELAAVADKFGDKRAQALLEGGYIKELIEYQDSQRSAYKGIAEMLPKIEAEHVKKQAAEEAREAGKTESEIYHEFYAPAYSNTIANLKVQKFQSLKSEGKSDTEAWQEVERTFPTNRAAQAVPATQLTQESFEGLKKQGIEVDPATQAAALGVMTEKGAKSGEAKAAFANAMSEIQTRLDKGEKVDSVAAGQIIREAMTAASGQTQKIDQAIINQLPNYPEMNRQKLGYIGSKSQERIMTAIQSSEQIEHIADYAAQNPEAIGLLADASRRINVDAYKGLITDYAKYIPKVTTDRDSAIDAEAKRKGLSQDQAEKAKVLNKMLATQAFADAAQAGSRGATIYLDKAFREIYQQASSPPAFFDILTTRQRDSDNLLSKYGLSLDKRKDAAEKFPFYSKPEAFLERAVKPKAKAGAREAGKSYPEQTPNPQYPIWGGDGKWYSEDEWKQKSATGKRSEIMTDEDPETVVPGARYAQSRPGYGYPQTIYGQQRTPQVYRELRALAETYAQDNNMRPGVPFRVKAANGDEQIFLITSEGHLVQVPSQTNAH